MPNEQSSASVTIPQEWLDLRPYGMVDLHISKCLPDITGKFLTPAQLADFAIFVAAFSSNDRYDNLERLARRVSEAGRILERLGGSLADGPELFRKPNYYEVLTSPFGLMIEERVALIKEMSHLPYMQFSSHGHNFNIEDSMRQLVEEHPSISTQTLLLLASFVDKTSAGIIETIRQWQAGDPQGLPEADRKSKQGYYEMFLTSLQASVSP